MLFKCVRDEIDYARAMKKLLLVASLVGCGGKAETKHMSCRTTKDAPAICMDYAAPAGGTYIKARQKDCEPDGIWEESACPTANIAASCNVDGDGWTEATHYYTPNHTVDDLKAICGGTNKVTIGK